MKKYISLFVIVLLVIAGLTVLYNYFTASKYHPLVSTSMLTLEEAEEKGLHIQDMSIDKGLTGWYERGEYVIYFGSKRDKVNPWIERTFFDAPMFTIYTVFSDDRGQEFSVSGGLSGGNSLELPHDKKVSKIDQSDVNFKLMLETIDILKQVKIDPSLDYEYDAIVSQEKSIRDDGWAK